MAGFGLTEGGARHGNTNDDRQPDSGDDPLPVYEVWAAVHGLPVEKPVLRSDARELLLPGSGGGMVVRGNESGATEPAGAAAVDAPVAPHEGADSVRAVVCAAEYTWDCSTALAVFRCESGLEPGAIDPTRENWGLAQLNEFTWRPFFGEERWARVLEAEENLAMAHVIYERAGRTFLPWACRP